MACSYRKSFNWKYHSVCLILSKKLSYCLIFFFVYYSKAGLGSYTFTEDLVQGIQRYLDDHKYTGAKEGVKVLESLSGLHSEPFDLLPYLDVIQRCFDKHTMPQVMRALEKEAKINEWAAKQYEKIKKKSPLSLVVTLEAFNRSKDYSINQVLCQDFRLTTRFLVIYIFYFSSNINLIKNL